VPRYRNVLVAHDGSREADLALAHAVAMAQVYRARVRLVAVVPPPPLLAWQAPGGMRGVHEAEQTELAEALRAAADRIPDDLSVTTQLLDGDPARARALVELEDRILERAAAGDEARVSAAELRRRYDVPREVLERLAELEVLTPTSRGYSPSDVKIVEAISRFRAGGYDERIGFTVYDTLRYKRALEALVEEEVEVLMERLAGEMDTDRAVELIEDGSEPLRDLIAALHQKLLVAEMKRQRAARV
jgi:nucleotide-binding universal stress UspA family protein